MGLFDPKFDRPVLAVSMFEEAPFVPDIELVVTSTKPNGAKGDHIPSLSPFFLGPCTTPDGLEFQCVENIWQYSKVYAEHIDDVGNPTDAWYAWRKRGARSSATRYPMGKGAKPIYALWDNMHLSIIPARKLIYAPSYAKAARLTPDFKRLRKEARHGARIILRCWDCYSIHKTTSSYLSVINDPDRKFGHGFVLAMMLDLAPRFYEGLII